MGIHLMPPLFELIIKPESHGFEYYDVIHGAVFTAFILSHAIWPDNAPQEGQVFMPVTRHTLKQVKLPVVQYNLTGNVIISIKATVLSGGLWIPAGDDLISVTVLASSLPAYSGTTPPFPWTIFDFGAGMTVEKDTHYAICALAPSGDAYQWGLWFGDTLGEYARGTNVFRNMATDPPGPWFAVAAVDLLFYELGVM